MKHITSKLLLLAIITFIVSLYVIGNTSERHDYVGEDGNKKLCKALHIALPGYAYSYSPEQEVDLRKWAGTKHIDFTAVNTKDGTENPEATASMALKAMGLFTDYELKQKGDHYILHKEAETHKYFTMRAWYRIWKWKKAE
jgi:hypothetical protein